MIKEIMEEMDEMFDSFKVADHSKPIQDILKNIPTPQESLIKDVWLMIDSQLRPQFKLFLDSALDKAKQEGREEGYERVLQVKSDALDTLLLIMKNACIEERERILKVLENLRTSTGFENWASESGWNSALTSLKEQITRIEK